VVGPGDRVVPLHHHGHHDHLGDDGGEEQHRDDDVAPAGGALPPREVEEDQCERAGCGNPERETAEQDAGPVPQELGALDPGPGVGEA
jgi:hypothetical protein